MTAYLKSEQFLTARALLPIWERNGPTQCQSRHV